jgi:hypothetical protein
MINIISVVIATVLVIVGVYFQQDSNIQISQNVGEENREQVLSESVEKESNETSSPSPSQTPSETPFQEPTQKPQMSVSELDDFIYPNSIVVEKGEDFIRLTSQDNPDVITDWYKEKIKSLSMNVKSFVTTKTNDKVLNKLAGAKSGFEANVEIEKEPQEPTTRIMVSVE